MKLVKSIILVSAIILPVSVFAQTSYNPVASVSNDSGITREQVRAELIQVEKAGYNPAERDVNYPDDIQKAERKIYQQNHQ